MNYLQLALIMGAVLSHTVGAQEQSPFTFKLGPLEAVGGITVNNADYQRVQEGSTVHLRVQARPQRFSGINLHCRDNFWDLSAYSQLRIKVKNLAQEKVSVWASVKGRSTSAPENTAQSAVPAAATLAPDQTGFIDIALYANGQRLADDTPIYPGRGFPIGSGDLDLTKVNQISIYINKSTGHLCFEVLEVATRGRVQAVAKEDFFPFVDELGQYRHSTWPGKLNSGETLPILAKKERAALQTPSAFADRNAYGGSPDGPNATATGYFYTQKIDGTWWLIDPDGHRFFSHGVNGVGGTSPTPVDQREHYYASLPQAGSLASCWGQGCWAPHGFYKGKSPYKTFDFLKANLIRKYGQDWKTSYRDMTHRRFKHWGINTLGNWSSSYMRSGKGGSKIPYVVSGSSGGAKSIEGSTGWWRKFPDPFDPSFQNAVRESLRDYADSVAQDPYCIGFFIDNEQSWGDETTLALASLKSLTQQAAKLAFVNALKERYGTVAKLTAAWGVIDANSWDELLARPVTPNSDNETVTRDLLAFNTKLVRRYFEICRQEVKRVAPNHMYLGCRFSAEMMHNQVLQTIAQEYCDVITYNIYNLYPYGFATEIDKPVLIGEFHFGALDRGVFHTGLWYARDQKQRAELYTDYVKYAIAHPLIVGTHWFQYPAQSPTGRGDGENFQIGFADICDQPYPELVEAIKAVSIIMYE